MKVRGTVLALAVVLASACAYTPTTSLVYRPIPVEASPRVQPRLIVKPLSEARPPRSYPNEFGNLFKTYIPLLPYVRIPYERLDETSLIHEERKQERHQGLERTTEHFTAAIAKAIADDLRSSGLFREVLFSNGASVEASDAYILEGDLKSTEFDKYATSYMLGAPGVLLWFVLPCGEDAATVEADLRLRDPEGRVVWEHTLSGRSRRIFTLYSSTAPISSAFKLEIHRYGSNSEGIDGDSLWAYHASAARSGMEDVKNSLAAFLD